MKYRAGEWGSSLYFSLSELQLQVLATLTCGFVIAFAATWHVPYFNQKLLLYVYLIRLP